MSLPWLVVCLGRIVDGATLCCVFNASLNDENNDDRAPETGRDGAGFTGDVEDGAETIVLVAIGATGTAMALFAVLSKCALSCSSNSAGGRDDGEDGRAILKFAVVKLPRTCSLVRACSDANAVVVKKLALVVAEPSVSNNSGSDLPRGRIGIALGIDPRPTRELEVVEISER